MRPIKAKISWRYQMDICFPLVLGLLIFALAFAALSWNDIQYASDVSQETLDLLRKRIVRYEGYLANDETKSLVRLLDKTNELAQRLSRTSKQTEEFLSEYAYEQRLDGILVLDENRNIVLASTGANDAEAAHQVRVGQNIQQIIDHPVKNYITRTEWKGTEFDVVAVARQGEEKGVVICYFSKNSIKNNNSDITFETLLDGYNFELSGVGGISNGETFISSDEENAELMAALAAEMENVRQEDKYCSMLHFWSQNQKWYGRMLKDDNGYDFYIAFPSKSVYETRNLVLASGTFLYVMFWLFYLLMRSRAKQESMARIQKQFRIINAINRAYTTNFLIQLKEDRLEPIKFAPKLESKVLSMRPASRKLKAIAKICLDKDEQARFVAFTDPATVAERMGKNPYLVMDYEDRWGQWYQSLIIPQKYDENGQLVAVLMATRNISEEKRREHAYQEQLRRSVDEAERASQAKTQFLRQMSHDIRTPINGIRGMVEIGNNVPDDAAKQAECRQKVWEASGFLLELVNSVLDMNKLESSEIKAEEKPFDLIELVRNTQDILYGQANSSGITMELNQPSVNHRYLVGSPLHLRQVLQNIGSNAIKYNKKNGTVCLTTREIASDSETATFEFISRDTGIGMSEEFQKRAFEPFTQEEASARTKYQGSGLGLSICRELVEQMGGTIRLESEQGVGSTFTITLQFRIDTERQRQADAAEAEKINVAGMKVLLVEDNELNMEVAEFLLEREGIVVTKAWNGEEAVQTFTASKPGDFDVVLMDVMMPVKDGLDATREIRALEREDAKNIPIFAMTANAFADDIAHSRAAGMNEYIAKPLDIQRLRKTLFKYRK